MHHSHAIQFMWKNEGRCYILVINELQKNKQKVNYEVRALSLPPRAHQVRKVPVNECWENSSHGKGRSASWVHAGSVCCVSHQLYHIIPFSPTPLIARICFLSLGSCWSVKREVVTISQPVETHWINLKPDDKNTPAALSYSLRSSLYLDKCLATLLMMMNSLSVHVSWK